MSGDWGTTHYRRKVALELGITVEALDRGLTRFEAQEQSTTEYLSHSHNDRLRALAQILDIPLVRLASVDGVSSLLPTPKAAAKKRNSPPRKKKAASPRAKGTATRKKSTASTVPLKTFPWEVAGSVGSATSAAAEGRRTDVPPATASPKPKAAPKPEPVTCMSCFLPVNPHNGTCGCS